MNNPPTDSNGPDRSGPRQPPGRMPLLMYHPAIRTSNPHRKSIHANHFPAPSTPLAIASVHLTVQEIQSRHPCRPMLDDIAYQLIWYFCRTFPDIRGPQSSGSDNNGPHLSSTPRRCRLPRGAGHAYSKRPGCGPNRMVTHVRMNQFAAPLVLQPSRFHLASSNARQRYQPLLSRLEDTPTTK